MYKILIEVYVEGNMVADWLECSTCDAESSDLSHP